MKRFWEHSLKIKPTVIVVATCILFVSVNASAVTIGPALTKKERNRLNAVSVSRDSGKISEDELMSAFLKEDYSKVEKLTKPLTKRAHSHPEFDEMLYLRALSLMKLGRMDEARLQLSLLESQGLTENIKARAAYSLGDSYYFASGDLSAYRHALNQYPLFDEADMVRTRIREKQVLPPAPLPLKPLQQFSVVETPLYSVQVGSFSKEKNAKQLVSRLMRARYDAGVFGDDVKNIYRVRVGAFVSRHDALILERKLKKEGYPTKIVP